MRTREITLRVPVIGWRDVRRHALRTAIVVASLVTSYVVMRLWPDALYGAAVAFFFGSLFGQALAESKR